MEYEQFLLEAYRQNWQYRRFVEELRLKHVQAYLVLIGFFVTIFSVLIKDAGGSRSMLVDDLLYPFVVGASLFLSIYGFILTMFLIGQKRGYEQIRKRNDVIHDWFVHKAEWNAVLLKQIDEPSPIRRTPWPPFLGWLLLIILLHLAFLWLTSFLATRGFHWTLVKRAFSALLPVVPLLMWELRFLQTIRIPQDRGQR